MEDTIFSDSSFGKRLEKIRKNESFFLAFEGREIPVVSKITIGRDRDNNIPINDQLASRHHAIIQKIKQAYFIKDLGSTNGTFVNEEQAPSGKYVKLGSNDIIRIGRTQFSVRCLAG
jgi:pSer/pThr/pTyr-binding forkhead associated (FHA) protein